ncbi:SDR family oxidoreductase [Bradyrhizobium sp. BRP22]|uniref:SDR family oxidoreductase n=1 Tax=Bradyrhizobium sp. BRP22 TaxID=2793821 RepID=UPI001CD3EB54|nr:SDR family oxidoreductase [Bradyrhizobium sp. BRP22]MCA1452367.1 SDR family oxidoreductase [Bradyrhizobium sp. BRP22]
MGDDQTSANAGPSDDELARHPTVFAADALQDYVVVISGGAGGIGRAVAFLFARLGAHVALVGRNKEKLDALAAQLAGRHLKASAHAADIREPDAVGALFDAVWAAHGRVNCLVNSAGGQFPQAAIDFSIKGWNAVINTNLNGTWYMMQAAAQHWREQKAPGSIINIVVVTTHGLYGVAHTIAARSGVIGLSRAVAVEWAPLNIRVNCVAPGAIESEGWNVYSEQARAAYPRSNPMMRAGSPWDIAEACAYLAAPSGRFITGETLTIDGGGQLWAETWTTGKPEYFRREE